MPLQNRVDPCGAIISSEFRGTLMGNRGVLHNDERLIVRQFRGRRWIACLLEFKGRRRSVMSPGRYTELFFLDEAVALAAGHRPCAECRRERFNEFRNAFKISRRAEAGGPLFADEIDLELHRARIDTRGRKVTWDARLSTLPDGCFVQIDNSCYLVLGENLLEWSAEGYVKKRCRPSHSMATVLTPEPIVRCIRQGYRPLVHHSSPVISWTEHCLGLELARNRIRRGDREAFAQAFDRGCTTRRNCPLGYPRSVVRPPCTRRRP